jgi:hypothetical protein
MARNQLKARLIGYFDQRIGQIVTLDDLAREFDHFNSAQIRVGVNNLRNSPANESGGLDMKSSLQVVARGNAWCWRPVNATLPGANSSLPSKRCFEEIGPTKSGELLLQADDGSIWKAVEL